MADQAHLPPMLHPLRAALCVPSTARTVSGVQSDAGSCAHHGRSLTAMPPAAVSEMCCRHRWHVPYRAQAIAGHGMTAAAWGGGTAVQTLAARRRAVHPSPTWQAHCTLADRDNTNLGCNVCGATASKRHCSLRPRHSWSSIPVIDSPRMPRFVHVLRLERQAIPTPTIPWAPPERVILLPGPAAHTGTRGPNLQVA